MAPALDPCSGQRDVSLICPFWWARPAQWWGILSLAVYVPSFSGHSTSLLFTLSAACYQVTPSPGGGRTFSLAAGALITVGVLTRQEDCPLWPSASQSRGCPHTQGLGADDADVCAPSSGNNLLLCSPARTSQPPCCLAGLLCPGISPCWIRERKGRERKIKGAERRPISSSAGAFPGGPVLLIWTFSSETELPLLRVPATLGMVT